MAALTREEVKNYLRVDINDDDALIDMLMVMADKYLQGSIGALYNKEDERAKILSLLVVSDMYGNRENTEKVGATVRKLVDDFALQLRLELRV